MLAMPGQQVDDAQAGHRANGAGHKQKAQKKQWQDGIVVPGRAVANLDAVGDQDRTAEQDERPAAERDSALEFVSEYLVLRDRQRQQVLAFARCKQATIEYNPGRKDQQQRERQKEQVE